MEGKTEEIKGRIKEGPGVLTNKERGENTAVVGIYSSHTEAEASVKELQRSGFDMKKLSIVGKDYHTEEHVVGYYNTGDRMKVWGKLGAFWGGLWGLLFGSAFFFIPGIGPLIVFGPLVAWIVAALESAVVVGGLSVLGAALYGIGIPKDSIMQYETALKSDKFLVIAHGAPDEVTKARRILETTGAASVAAHELDLGGKRGASRSFVRWATGSISTGKQPAAREP